MVRPFRLVQEGGADLVKIDAAPDFPEAVTAVTRAGVPVFAQMGLSPQSGSKYGISIGDLQQPESLVPDEMMEQLIQEAQVCEQAGAAMRASHCTRSRSINIVLSRGINGFGPKIR